MTNYTTRSLTIEESQALVRSLHLTLGRMDLVHAVTRVIADQGLGVFVATEDTTTA